MSEVSIKRLSGWLAAALLIAIAPALSAQTLRIVSWNVNADTTDPVNFNNASATQVQTVLAGIGAEHLAGHAQPIDVLALEELHGSSNSVLSTTLATLVTDLDAAYPGSNYKADTTIDPTDGPTGTGNGPSGLIYNANTVVDVGAEVVDPSPSSGTDPRAPIRYTLQAAGDGAASQFYMYVEHAKADGGTANIDERAAESVLVRNDASTLGSNAHIIYSGDLNLAGTSSTDKVHSGSQELAYKNLTVASGGTLNDGSGNMTTAGAGQAFDPLNPSETFTNNNQTYEALFTESAPDATARFDYQLLSGPVLPSNNQPGLELIPNTQTAFGNTTYIGSTPSTSLIYTTNDNSTASVDPAFSGNTALADLPNRLTVLQDLTDISDHLPMVSDYTIAAVPEPASLGLLVFGSLLAIHRRRR
jgi:hypothetical protein